nr:MAG TPA: hypothetical protein [Caudoviricetes sp.]DAL81789.1 MAG TPA: hypothetical protein [Caudoviricetes sp.]
MQFKSETSLNRTLSDLQIDTIEDSKHLSTDRCFSFAHF